MKTRNQMPTGLAAALLGAMVVPLALGACGATASSASLATGTPATAPSWPAVSREMRPWAYWWWMGSAVDPTNLTRELQRYHDAGLGGLHIIPIYGAKGYENQYITYLSPEWMEMLRYTVTEAQRLDLGVDMTTGTGWCFGGPNVTDHEANALVVVKTSDVAAGGTLKVDRQAPQALMAFSATGQCLELTGRITDSGEVKWTPDSGTWRVWAISQRPSGQEVKRAAPGGEGHMLNLLYPDALRHYLSRFDDAFAHYTGPKPRAMYHDSYEYISDWSPDLLAQFERRRGYRLQTELPALFSDQSHNTPHATPRTEHASPLTPEDHAARVKYDYRQTVSDILAEESLPLWADWSRQHGFLTRNQAHGSPGNLLDLYAAADIPETEMFAQDRNPLVAKFASSAAHVTGKNLVAAETGTWLREHFTETLADMKYRADDMFLSGINHIFYHGTCYSPDEAGWPGWVFYASFEMNPRNSIWRDVPALNAYVARCQSLLQSGRPDNNILLYWPIHDFWQNPAGRLQHFTVSARAWFGDQSIGKAAQRLWDRGFAFDYVSDRQLNTAKTTHRRIALPGGAYQVVVVPTCELMPLQTLEKLLQLAEAGATVCFESRLPNDVPGLGNLEKRRAEFKKLVAGLKLVDLPGHQLKEAKVGQGRVLVGDLETALAQGGAAREPMVDQGLFFARRSFAGGRHYFIANLGQQPFDNWVSLAMGARSVMLLDPLRGRVGRAALRQTGEGKPEVYLQLQPRESVILRSFTDRETAGRLWSYANAAGQPFAIAGMWQVTFLCGGPALPEPFQTARLASWTDLGGEEAIRFAGTARYSITFDSPAASPARPWFLDLGRIHQSARVRLNGHDLGTVFTPPFRVSVDQLLAKGNVLEVEVTSTAANRIRDLDRRGVLWKNFHDINFVNVNYEPFDASNWPVTDSGLLGPVTLTPAAPALLAPAERH